MTVGQRPRELVPTTSAAHALGAELRRRRVERGLSQVELGGLVHHSGALVAKVEKAERRPSRAFCALVDAALETGGLFSRLRVEAEVNAPAGPPCLEASSWTMEAAVRFAAELTGGPVDRRAFLALTGAALTTSATHWSAAVAGIGQRVVAPGGVEHGGRLGAAARNRLSRRLADLRRLDDELGGTVLREVAVAELSWLTGLARSSQRHEADRRGLLGLMAEAAQVCGWVHVDAGMPEAAQAYYVTALRCSAAAGDLLAGAHVLGGMSFQATLSGRTTEALALLDAAQERAGKHVSPKLRAAVATRRARAHARAGDTRACGRALHAAEQALDAADDGRAEPEWIYYVDTADLAGQAAECWVDLRQPDRARPVIDTALAAQGPQYVRDRTIYLVRSAQTHWQTRELEAACADLTRAATLVGATGSIRSIETISAARRAMSRYDREPAVRQFDETLATTLRQAC
jgi:transcriptional regulator with XRE-family HTH domain